MFVHSLIPLTYAAVGVYYFTFSVCLIRQMSRPPPDAIQVKRFIGLTPRVGEGRRSPHGGTV